MTLQYLQDQIKYAQDNNCLFIGLALKKNNIYPNILIIPKDNFNQLKEFINLNYDNLNIIRIEFGFTIDNIIDNIYNNCVNYKDSYTSFNLTNYFPTENMNGNNNSIYSTFTINNSLSSFSAIDMNDIINIQDNNSVTLASTDEPLNIVNEYVDNKGLNYNYFEFKNDENIFPEIKLEKKYNDFSYQFQKLTKEQLIEILSSLSEEELKDLGYQPIKKEEKN